MEILFAVIALIVGLAIGFLMAKVKFAPLEGQIKVLNERLNEQQRASASRLEEEKRNAEMRIAELLKVSDARLEEEKRNGQNRLEEQRRSSQQYMAQLVDNHAKSIAQLKEHNRDSLEAMQGRFDETVAKMKAELETVTADLLKRRQQEFEETSKNNVSKILEPLNDNLKRMREAVNDNTIKHSEFGGQLTSNLKMVMEHSDAARKSADRLADALRGGGKIQGDWGETVLTELLELQGLREGVHFDTQVTMRDASGNPLRGEDNHQLRPDVILHLDRYREVIIDAKVSLSAFMDYMNAETEELRAQALKSHVQSIENHVKELSLKNYSAYIVPPKTKVDYVIMFVPSTAALYAATNAKKDLWRKAMERNVYIADEQTLYAALRIIDMTWRQIAQAENHEKVFSLANEMIDRVSAFIERFSRIGAQLDGAKRSYDDAMMKLRDSGQSIPQTCRKLIKLGATVRERRGVDPSFFAVGQVDEIPELTQDPTLELTQDTSPELQ